MPKDIVSPVLYIFLTININWQASLLVPEEVPNSGPDSIAGGFLFTPMINFELLSLQPLQQFCRDFFDPLDFSRRQIRFPQQVENRQDLLVKPFPYRSALFITQGLFKHEQCFKGLLNGHPVLFTVVLFQYLFILEFRVSNIVPPYIFG